jgi:hypothetical protein
VKLVVEKSEDVTGLKDLIVDKLKLGVAPDDVSLKLLKLDGTEEALDSMADIASCLTDRSRVIVHVASIASIAPVVPAPPPPSKEVFVPPVGALWGRPRVVGGKGWVVGG